MDDATSTTEESSLPAGAFSSWMTQMGRALRGDQDADVPCGGCTACCTSSQFIHIAPEETDTLAHIPAALLFRAPRAPRGHVLLGYDEHGRCPMLIDNRCSIYEHRPRTCRTYDCRVFPAAGLAIEDDKVSIRRQARRWVFDEPTSSDRNQHDAVRAAATFLSEHKDLLGDGPGGPSGTQLAVLAIEIHEVFLGRDVATGHPAVIEPHPEVVRAAARRRLQGDVSVEQCGRGG